MDIAERALHEGDPIEELAESILKLTIEEYDVTNGTSAEEPATSVPEAFVGIAPRAAVLFNQIANGQYGQLGNIDEQVNSRCKEVLARLDSLASPNSAVDQDVLRFLEQEDLWLKTTLAKVNIFVASNQSVMVLKEALVGRLDSIIDAVDCYKLILENQLPGSPQEGPRIYDTGT